MNRSHFLEGNEIGGGGVENQEIRKGLQNPRQEYEFLDLELIWSISQEELITLAWFQTVTKAEFTSEACFLTLPQFELVFRDAPALLGLTWPYAVFLRQWNKNRSNVNSASSLCISCTIPDSYHISEIVLRLFRSLHQQFLYSFQKSQCSFLGSQNLTCCACFGSISIGQ